MTLTVDYKTENGTAIAYEDYIPISGTFRFDPGENKKVLFIHIGDDMLPGEDVKTLFLELLNPVGGKLGMPYTTTISIIDDDFFRSYLPMITH